jgi:signal transduction histidine kinase
MPGADAPRGSDVSPWTLPRDLPGHIPVGRDLTLGLQRIVATAVEMVGAESGVLVLIDEDDVVNEFVQAGRRPLPDLLGRSRSDLGLLGDHLLDTEAWLVTDLVDETGSAAVVPGHDARTLVAVPVRVRGTVAGLILLIDRSDGEAFDEYDIESLQPLGLAVTASRENARLYLEMQRRERWLEASNDVTTAVLSGAPTRDVLALIAGRVEECTPADGVAIMMIEPDGRTVVEFASGEASSLFNGMVADESWRAVSTAMMSGGPVVIDDLGATGRSEHPAFRALGPCMLLPMRANQRTLGAIAVANYREGRKFDPVDLAMAQAFAGQTALAAVLSEARDERERLLVFEERDRIARDLHDLVIQRLFAAGMMLQGTARGEQLTQHAADRVSRVVDELDATVREIRQTIFALNQPLDGEVTAGLRARILREVSVAQPVLGFQPHLRIEGAVDSLVPDSVGGHLIAALREALSNVARHADATSVDVWTRIRGDEVVLEVIDDGQGVPEGGRRSGLRNLAIRAAGLGGWCSTEPANPDGTGTRLTWRARIR